MFDLLVKGGRTIEGDPLEIAIADGTIVACGPHVKGEAKRELHLEPSELISAGWIDEHVHCYPKMELYRDEPDCVGVACGVTSLIDAGTTGADDMPRFHEIAQAAKTNVFALVNIAKTGIVTQDELADLSRIQRESIARTLADLPGFAIGIKARMSASVVGGNGVEPLRMAKHIQDELACPLMVHIGSNPPELADILGLMDRGDVLTHTFNGKPNGILDVHGRVRPCVWSAHDRGVVFDLGHGTDSFSFATAEAAMAQGLRVDGISTDIYVRNRVNGPVYSMATTMEKMRLVGYGWPEIIERVTARPAQHFGLTRKGRVAAGADADLTVFRIEREEHALLDSCGCEYRGSEHIRPLKTIVGGIVYDNQL